MFSNFTNQKPVEKVSFRRIESLDENEKKQVVSTLGVIPPDSTVIYGGTQKDNMLVFGYYSLDRLPITKSSFFSDLCEITKNINGADPKSDFYNKPSIHISSWVFDEAIRNEKALDAIFSAIVQYYDPNADRTYLWTDTDTKELLYYPLEKSDIQFGNKKAVSYFRMAFFRL